MKNRPFLSVCLLILSFICAAVFFGGGKLVREQRPSALEQYAAQGDYLEVQGQVFKIEQKEKTQAVYLKDNSIQSEKYSFTEAKLLVYTDPKIKLKTGNIVQVSGEVSFFDKARNPGNFDQRLYYQKQDIHGMLWGKHVRVTDDGYWQAREWLTQFRLRWKEMVIQTLGSRDGAVLNAMLLGEKAEMDTEIKALYQANGIGHILAISGLHLSFIGVGIYKVLRRLTGSYGAGGGVGILFLGAYILMIGFTVSAVRALVMFLFRTGADITGRHYDAPTALAASAVIVLAWRPLYLYDGGFWLSFGAVFAMIVMLPLVKDLPVQGIWAGVCVHLVILPVLLYYFYEFPVYSILLNLWVIPLMSLLLALGIAGSILCGAHLAAGGWLLKGCQGILWLYEKGCEAALELPGARIVTGKPGGWRIFLYYLLLAAVILWWRRENEKDPENKRQKERGKRRAAVQTAVLLLGGVVFLVGYRGDSDVLNVVALDVGQGDSVFIRGETGGAYLVDGGSSDVKEAGRYRIEPFLKAEGVGRLDYVFVTHGDSDHINGIEELLERQKIGVKITRLVLPVKETWDEALKGLAKLAGKHGTKVEEAKPGFRISEGEMHITCLQPGEDSDLEAGNAASMILALQSGEFDMLLTGDVEAKGEEALTEILQTMYQDRTWEVLKAAHHGSKNSSRPEFLECLRPACAVISAGRDNRYGHPHKETVHRLEEAGAGIYSTQENGAVRFQIKNERLYVKTWLQKGL